MQSSRPMKPTSTMVIVRLSVLRKTILNREYQVFMCDCVFVDGCVITCGTSLGVGFARGGSYF